MVSLATGRPAGPDPRPLIERLEASARPAVVQYPDVTDAQGRIEVTRALRDRLQFDKGITPANVID